MVTSQTTCACNTRVLNSYFWTLIRIVSEGTQWRVQGVTLASEFSQSIWASIRCAGPTSSIHGGSASHPTRLEGSASNVLVSETTGHLQGSCSVQASSGSVLFWQLVEDQQHIGQNRLYFKPYWPTVLF